MQLYSFVVTLVDVGLFLVVALVPTLVLSQRPFPVVESVRSEDVQQHQLGSLGVLESLAVGPGFDQLASAGLASAPADRP